MGAIVVDLNDMGVRTPEQAVRVFFESFDPEEVRVGLWEAFRGFALATETITDKELPDIGDVANLFDGLISLVNGICELQIKTNGRCVICGRSDDASGRTGGNNDDDLVTAG
ncbi:hypothetical protein FHW88_004936 [Mucilaginibacter sp. SG538B]|uniref:hypothetical protein n=1 Tax=Mucilaginibacter sp. SG538B TaxID=2587021 RepID=UPI00159E8999|nr:hypothetical protein [Mucilaginibacter sp. SG538B]NVM66618.1 hypothetical protein [Mucilaginibacter sp. SG538B]